jgi:hypothetical protein
MRSVVRFGGSLRTSSVSDCANFTGLVGREEMEEQRVMQKSGSLPFDKSSTRRKKVPKWLEVWFVGAISLTRGISSMSDVMIMTGLIYVHRRYVQHARLFPQGHPVVIWIQQSRFKNAPARPRTSPAKISEYLASCSPVVACVTGQYRVLCTEGGV